MIFDWEEFKKRIEWANEEPLQKINYYDDYLHYSKEDIVKIMIGGVRQMNKKEKHEKICKELNKFYALKNADYGDSFGKSFEEYGMLMACIRLEDKLNRLKALTKNKEQKVKDESIEDTLADLANYAIMTLVELKNKN